MGMARGSPRLLLALGSSLISIACLAFAQGQGKPYYYNYGYDSDVSEVSHQPQNNEDVHNHFPYSGSAQREGPSSGVQVCPSPEEVAPCQCRMSGSSAQIRCTSGGIEKITDALTRLRQRLTLVDVLILEGNSIPHLPSRAFGSARISRLFLESNKIMTVDRNAFAGIEEFLTELYIKEPQLRSLPKDSVDFLKRLEVLSLEESRIISMPRLAGMWSLKLLKVDGSQVREVAPQSLRDMPSLKYLHLTNSDLSRLDTGVLSPLHSSLTLVNLTNNKISWIHPRAFRQLDQLSEVSLRGNRLEDATLVGRAVQMAGALRHLDLSGNLFESLPTGSFEASGSLEELDLSFNRIGVLRSGCIAQMPRLRTVDLCHNRISSFHSDAFMGTEAVEDLRLRDNDLTQLADVSFVMDALPRLRVLDLGDNEIRGVPFGALRGYPALERLSLASNQIVQVSRNAFADMPSLEDLDLSDNKLMADSLETPIFGPSLPNLKSLDLSRNKLSVLDRRLFGPSTLGNLRRLDLSRNGITLTDSGALANVGRLEHLNISCNNIRELKPEFFAGLAGLVELDASQNELVALPDDLLANQTQLEHVSFARNQIQLVSEQFLPSSSRGMSNLRHLDMTGNFVQDLPSELLGRLVRLERLLFGRNSLMGLARHSFGGSVLPNLKVINLHDNRIQSIQEGAFEGLPALRWLDLSLNIVDSVGDTLDPLASLVRLNLSDNYIRVLPRNAFRTLTQLTALDVSNNTIVEIGDAFSGMGALRQLDLSFNHLPTVRAGEFRNLPELTTLQCDHNSITYLEAGAFQDLPKLETLTLAKNGISRLERATFRNLPMLEELRLDDNLIEAMDEEVIVDLFSLKELHLQHNLIQGLGQATFANLPSLRHLNVSYNLIQSLPLTGFQELGTLETLDLSFNDLRSIDERAFDNLKWLTKLKLNDNNICKIHQEAFRDTSSLRSLTLSNNRLTTIEESAFMNIRQWSITNLKVSGNPLTCNCNTLWLRKLVSEENSVVKDEPVCNFPAQLEGNPMKKLRTSRFTCDTTQASSRRSSTDDGISIQEACRGLPLKPAPQKQLLDKVASGPASGPSILTVSPTTVSSSFSVIDNLNGSDSSVEVDEEATDGQDGQIDKIDIDVVGSSSSAAPDYEYYYVYYDEDGNKVNKSEAQKLGTHPTVGPGNLQQQQQPEQVAVELSNSSPQNGQQSAELIQPPASSDIQVGDTPTLYAQIQNITKFGGDQSAGANAPAGEEEEGFTIFGIPIPKIPLPILSFGLAPVLSHGLLPIGRKGDPYRPNDNDDSDDVSKDTYQASSPNSPFDSIRKIFTSINQQGQHPLGGHDTDGNQDPSSTTWGEETSDEDYNMQPDRALSNPSMAYKVSSNPVIPLRAKPFKTKAMHSSHGPPLDGEVEDESRGIAAFKFDHPEDPTGSAPGPNTPVWVSPSLSQFKEDMSSENDFHQNRDGENPQPMYSTSFTTSTNGEASFEAGNGGFRPVFQADSQLSGSGGSSLLSYKAEAYDSQEVERQGQTISPYYGPGIMSSTDYIHFSDQFKDLSAFGKDDIMVESPFHHETLQHQQDPQYLRKKNGAGERDKSEALDINSYSSIHLKDQGEPFHDPLSLIDTFVTDPKDMGPLIKRMAAWELISQKTTTLPPVVWGKSPFDISNRLQFSEESTLMEKVLDSEESPKMSHKHQNQLSETAGLMIEGGPVNDLDIMKNSKDNVAAFSKHKLDISSTTISSTAPSTTTITATTTLTSITTTATAISTTERSVPTLHVEEVLSHSEVRNELQEISTSTAASTSLSTPSVLVEVRSMTSSRDGEPYDTIEAAIDGVINQANAQNGTSNEYVYYYEYYEYPESEVDPGDPIKGNGSVVGMNANTVSKDHIAVEPDSEEMEKTRLKGASGISNNGADGSPKQKKKPTLAPPIRSSTFDPYEGLYSDVKISSISVNTQGQTGKILPPELLREEAPPALASPKTSKKSMTDYLSELIGWEETRASPKVRPNTEGAGSSMQHPQSYLFHPDQLDPTAAAETGSAQNAEMDWYYSQFKRGGPPPAPPTTGQANPSVALPSQSPTPWTVKSSAVNQKGSTCWYLVIFALPTLCSILKPGYFL